MFYFAERDPKLCWNSKSGGSALNPVQLWSTWEPPWGNGMFKPLLWEAPIASMGSSDLYLYSRYRTEETVLPEFGRHNLWTQA